MEDKTEIWDILYARAKEVLHPRRIAKRIEAGGVASALLTKDGNIYTGVCIDTACSLGMCAERNAIANMITNGEQEIDKIVAVFYDGSVGYPCGACREMMMQLSEQSKETEILVRYPEKKIVKLRELLPNWWDDGGQYS